MTSAYTTGKGDGERNEAGLVWSRALSLAGVFFSRFFLFVFLFKTENTKNHEVL